MSEFTHTWDRTARPWNHKGKPCRIVATKGYPAGLVLIEFKDGGKFIVEREGLAPIVGQPA